MNPTSFIRLSLLLLATTWTLPVFAGKEKPAAVSSLSDARRAAIVSFCRKCDGRKVGDGECWALANEAFKATGAQRPAGQVRVWGRRLDLRRESPLPGDILECERTRFSDGSYVPTQHTAVIVAVYSPTSVRIAEQNYAGRKRVHARDLDLSGVRGGSIYIYRPQ